MVTHLPFENVPLIGGTVKNIGRIIDISNYPCSPTPLIWVEAAFSAAPRAIWSYFKPDPTQISFSRRKGPHRTGLGFNPWNGIMITEGEVMQVGGRIGQVLFRVGAAIELGLNWVLIADIGSNFLYNWISTAYGWQGCLPDPTLWAMFGPDPGGQVVVPGNQAFLLALTGGDAIFDGVNKIVIPAGGDFTCSFGISFKAWAPAPELFAGGFIEIRDTVTDHLFHAGWSTPNSDGSVWSAGWHGRPPRVDYTRGIQCRITMPAGKFADVGDSIATAGGRFNMLADP